MTDEELSQIEARAARAAEWTPEMIANELTEGVYDMPAIENREEFLEAARWLLSAALDARQDIPALVAEVRRLKAALASGTDNVELEQRHINDLSAENERLRGEVEACRKAHRPGVLTTRHTPYADAGDDE